jgi:hypothetical protein
VVASRRPCNRYYYKKHARSLTKKLYDVTLGNLLGYNKKFLSDNFDLSTVSQSQTNSFSSPCTECRHLCFTACSQTYSPN